MPWPLGVEVPTYARRERARAAWAGTANATEAAAVLSRSRRDRDREGIGWSILVNHHHDQHFPVTRWCHPAYNAFFQGGEEDRTCRTGNPESTVCCAAGLARAGLKSGGS